MAHARIIGDRLSCFSELIPAVNLALAGALDVLGIAVKSAARHSYCGPRSHVRDRWRRCRCTIPYLYV